MKYVETAMERLEKNPTPAGNEKGVLEKLMYLNRHTAKIMAFDMLLAGVDTVRTVLVLFTKNSTISYFSSDRIRFCGNSVLLGQKSRKAAKTPRGTTNYSPQ
jgi:hypothetical protein